MLQKQFLLFIFLFLSFLGFTQISTQPALPVASQGVIVTFDSSKESRLGYFTGDLYAHTGVNIDGKGNWQYVIGNWGDNTIQPKLTHLGNGIYELEIKPDVNTFYTVNAGEKVVQMAMVFRSADGKKQTNDLFINVNSLLVKILEPSVKSFLNLNQSVTISANSSQEASLKIYTDGNVWEQISDTEITANYTFNQSGTFWIFAEATTSVETARDSVQVYINDGVVTKAKPAAYKKGINYRQ